MENFLQIAQIIVSIVLIVVILLQQRGTAMGSAFGGSGGGSFYATRRGIQKKLLWGTVIFAILFVVLSVIKLIFY